MDIKISDSLTKAARTSSLWIGNVSSIICPQCKNGRLILMDFSSLMEESYGWGQSKREVGMSCRFRCNNKDCDCTFTGSFRH